MIIRQMKINPFDQFCYIIGCEETNSSVVIDPGGEANCILDKSKKLGLKIEYVFNTHSHHDHIGGNSYIKEQTNAKLLIHELENYRLADDDILIKNEMAFKVGSLEFQIYHTPGHSSGSLCFFIDKNLFTGDTLFVSTTGRVDLPGGNKEDMAKSLQRITTILSPDTIIWPGHDYGPTVSSTIEHEKKTNTRAKLYNFN